MSPNSKDVVLFINSMQAPTHSALRSYEKKTGTHFTPVVIVDTQIQESIHSLNAQDHLAGNAVVITADFDSPNSIRQALKPYEDRIVCVVSQYENSIHEFKKLIPYVPYVGTPTESSLDWATDKRLMREAFDAYDPSLSPTSIRVEDASPATVASVESKLVYPVIVKPSGLERSLLVSIAHNSQELADQLKNTFEGLREVYKTWMKRLEPAVLVEEFMKGDMYSIDAYVSADGSIRHAPIVKVVTGRDVGFDDFFAYLLLTDSGLSDAEVKAAQHTTDQACRALGLRSVSAHTELMKTASGWKIIEVGPRIGGYRHELYSLSHDINHIMNDIVNRTDRVPEISANPVRHAAVFATYPMKQIYQEGEMLRFARNNGDPTIEITLCHEDEVQLRKDIEAAGQLIQIEVMAEKPVAAQLV
jgi:hypothetical protein